MNYPSSPKSLKMGESPKFKTGMNFFSMRESLKSKENQQRNYLKANPIVDLPDIHNLKQERKKRRNTTYDNTNLPLF